MLLLLFVHISLVFCSSLPPFAPFPAHRVRCVIFINFIIIVISWRMLAMPMIRCAAFPRSTPSKFERTMKTGKGKSIRSNQWVQQTYSNSHMFVGERARAHIILTRSFLGSVFFFLFGFAFLLFFHCWSCFHWSVHSAANNKSLVLYHRWWVHQSCRQVHELLTLMMVQRQQ